MIKRNKSYHACFFVFLNFEPYKCYNPFVLYYITAFYLPSQYPLLYTKCSLTPDIQKIKYDDSLDKSIYIAYIRYTNQSITYPETFTGHRDCLKAGFVNKTKVIISGHYYVRNANIPV